MAATSSPVIACARTSCQIGALGKRDVHSIVEQLRLIRDSMRPPEHRIKLFLLKDSPQSGLALKRGDASAIPVAVITIAPLRGTAPSIVDCSLPSRAATG